MPYTIDRQSLLAGPFTATNDANTSAKVSLAGFAGAMVFVDAITGASDTITWHVCKTLGNATTYPAVDASGSAVTTAVESGKAYALPEALFGCQFCVPVMGAGNATISVSLKG